jgi:uncharacterized membrane protein
MITGQLSSEQGNGQLVLSPNLSAGWRSTKIFIVILCSFSLGIALIFALAGLWMILPFAGAEVMALLLLMHRVACKCYRKQVIQLSPTSIRIEQGRTAPQLVWESPLFWARLQIQASHYHTHAPKIFLRGQNDKIELGDFLHEQEKQELIKKLRPFVHCI